MMQGMDSRKINMVEKQGQDNMKAVGRELNAQKDYTKKVGDSILNQVAESLAALKRECDESAKHMLVK